MIATLIALWAVVGFVIMSLLPPGRRPETRLGALVWMIAAGPAAWVFLVAVVISEVALWCRRRLW